MQVIRSFKFDSGVPEELDNSDLEQQIPESVMTEYRCAVCNTKAKLVQVGMFEAKRMKEANEATN